MDTCRYIGGAALGMLLASMTAQADGKLSWFGETTFTGAYPTATNNLSIEAPSVGSLLNNSPDWAIRSGAKLLERQLALDTVFSGGEYESADKQVLRSELGVSLGAESISVPLSYRRAQYRNGDSRKLDSFGVKWRHHFDGAGSLTLLARYGKGAYQYGAEPSQDAANTLASVSWNSGFEHSGVTGSLYLGDERVIDTQTIEAQRRVYGFAVGGHWNLGSEHTPYVSLRYQTSDQPLLSGLTDYDRYTRISAGWNWQVRSNWQVRAEANFTYDEPRWNLLNFDRTRIQFSTRYDIK